MKREARKRMLEQVDVYPVTCRKLSEGRTNIEVLRAVIKGGAKIVQLREKDLSKKELYELALTFREITTQAGVLLMINDHLDIALASGADGAHLGQDDLPIRAARKIAPELLLGASTHSVEEALSAQSDGADYINIGPIFPTKTKDGVDYFLGPEAVVEIGSKVRTPFTVMGGITQDNIREVLEKGARRIAMVTAITKAADIEATVRALKEQIRNSSF